MAKWLKILDGMRNNPKDDWQVSDFETVCNHVEGVVFMPPRRGSHFKVAHPKVKEILTIPANKPIKAFYVKQFVSMIDSIIEEGTGQ